MHYKDILKTLKTEKFSVSSHSVVEYRPIHMERYYEPSFCKSSLEIDGHDYQTIISNLEDWMKAFGKMEQDNVRMRKLLQEMSRMAKEVEIK